MPLKSATKRHRTSAPLGVVLLLTLISSAGCKASSSRSASPVEGEAQVALSGLAEELVQSARLRADLSSLRVGVLEIQESHPVVGAARAAAPAAASSDLLGPALEQELTIALSRRLHLIDATLTAPRGPDEDLTALAERHGATHVVVGSYVRRPEDLLVSVRLVEADSRLIVATARGSVPPDALTSLPDARRPPTRSSPAGASLAGGSPDSAPVADVTRTPAAGLALPEAPAAARLSITEDAERPDPEVTPTAPATLGDPLALDASPAAAESHDAVLPPTAAELAEADAQPLVEGPALLRLRTHGVADERP